MPKLRSGDRSDRNNEIDRISFDQIAGELARADWVAWLLQHNFPAEQAEIGGYLLGEFIRGITDVYWLKKRQRKIPTDFIFPDILIHSEGDDHIPWSATTEKKNSYYAIEIDTKEIKYYASHDPQELVEIENHHDQIMWRGKIKDYFRDGGREEMNHIIDEQNKVTGTLLDPRISSSIEYDAQDHEYRALGTRIRSLINQEGSLETVDILMDRLRQAIKYRQWSKKRN